MGLIKKIALTAGKFKVALLLFCWVVLMSAPFVRASLGWMSLVALVPLLYTLDEMRQRKWSKRKTVFAIWLSGWVYLLVVMSWVLQINTGRWSYIPTSSLFALIVFSWISCTLVLSAGFVLFGWLVCKFQTRSDYIRLISVIPAAWVVAEYFRSVLASIVFIGPEGSMGTFFNFGGLGFAAASTPLSYAARLVGFFGLSFLVVSFSVAIYCLMKRRWRPALVIGGLVCLIAALGFLAYQAPKASTRHIAALQVGATEQRFYESELLNFLGSNPGVWSKPADVVALPEYANFFEQGVASNKQTIIQMLTHNQPTLFIYSRDAPAHNGLHKNELVYKTADGKDLSTQEKNFLIPAGEYLPYFHRFILKLIGHSQIVQVFNANTGVAKGSAPEHPVLYNSVSYGALACSGAIAPQLYQNMTSQGAEVLVNNASLNVFKNSPLYREQSESMIRFSAIANARPFVQAARGNYAYIFDQDGHVLAKSSELGVDLLEADVTPSSKQTLYTKFGEYMVVVSLLILIALAASSVKHRSKKPAKTLK